MDEWSGYVLMSTTSTSEDNAETIVTVCRNDGISIAVEATKITISLFLKEFAVFTKVRR